MARVITFPYRKVAKTKPPLRFAVDHLLMALAVGGLVGFSIGLLLGTKLNPWMG